jgi:hypothetical protein
MESEPTLVFCFDAFSSREPLPTSLENAIAFLNDAVASLTENRNTE